MIITETHTTELLSNTKMLLDISDSSENDILLYIINDTVNMILAYCRIEDFPEGLYGLIPQIAAKIYKTRDNIGGISSIAEGDRKINYTRTNVLSEYRMRLLPFMNIKAKLPSEVSAYAE